MHYHFIGKKLLFFIAHPDDETYLAVGTIDKNKQAEGESYIVCATAGERGKAHLDKPVKKFELKEIRKKELSKVSRLAGVKKLAILDLPDAKLIDNKAKLEHLFLDFAKKYKPDYIVSFGLDGVSGHRDHITCGIIARKVCRKTKIPFIAFCASPMLRRKGKLWVKNRRAHGQYRDRLKHNKPNVQIKVDPELKLKCFQTHRSQKPLHNMPENVKEDILNYEYFCAS